MRLNQFIAHAGICSRRKAEELIKAGEIIINGAPVIKLGYIVASSDVVMYKQQILTSEKQIYILLNKPLNTITSVHDPQGRKTVIAHMKNVAKGIRIYPVGRLDRNTTGLLVITNDGMLTKKLSHPSQKVEKIYQVRLKKKLLSIDLKKIRRGILLEDGMACVDGVECLDKSHLRIRLRLHSGKNRIIRRIFAHMGYGLRALDRVGYAGLKKGNLPVGAWRLLTQEEIEALKEM